MEPAVIAVEADEAGDAVGRARPARRPGQRGIVGPHEELGADAGAGREAVHDDALRVDAEIVGVPAEVLDRRLHIGLGLRIDGRRRVVVEDEVVRGQRDVAGVLVQVLPGMLLATIVPMLLVVLVKDMVGLADLYAVGVVGAIATNLGATATDRTLSIKKWERTLMFATFIVMAAIELSLLIDKPNARYFAVTILAVGLILRGLAQERRMKKQAPAAAPAASPMQITPASSRLVTFLTGWGMYLASLASSPESEESTGLPSSR